MNVGLMRRLSKCRPRRWDRGLGSCGDKLVWICTFCRDRKSAAEGSIFFGSHLSVAQVLLLGYCFAANETYASTKRILLFGQEPEVPDKTIASWFGYFRDRLIDLTPTLRGHPTKVGGPDIIMQIDEVQIGRRKYQLGRVPSDVWAIGFISANGDLRMEVCPKRDKKTLQDLIVRNVARGSIIHTDGWAR